MNEKLIALFHATKSCRHMAAGEAPLPSLPPKPCTKCGAKMSPEFVSSAMDNQGKRVTDDVRRYICDVCGYQEIVANVNE
jgi:hypothetical protein